MPKAIIDELTHLPLSRQRRYQIRMVARGRCPICGKPAVSGTRCPFHAAANHERLKRARLRKLAAARRLSNSPPRRMPAKAKKTA